jgi:hypothetical protein
MEYLQKSPQSKQPSIQNTDSSQRQKTSRTSAGDNSPLQHDQQAADSRGGEGSRNLAHPTTLEHQSTKSNPRVAQENTPPHTSANQLNSVPPSSESNNLSSTSSQQPYDPQIPLLNPDTQAQGSTTNHVFDLFTENESITAPVNNPTNGPSLFQRLQHTTNTTSDDLNRERLLVTIQNMRIKSKPRFIDKNGKGGNGKPSKRYSSRGIEDVDHERKVNGGANDLGSMEMGDSEMTDYIISTLSKKANNGPITRLQISAEDNSVNPYSIEKESTTPLEITDPITQNGTMTNKSLDTHIVSRVMDMRQHPNIDNGPSDNAVSTEKVVNQEEQGAVGVEVETVTPMVASEEVPTEASVTEQSEPVKKRRGRPPGSKNRSIKGKE